MCRQASAPNSLQASPAVGFPESRSKFGLVRPVTGKRELASNSIYGPSMLFDYFSARFTAFLTTMVSVPKNSKYIFTLLYSIPYYYSILLYVYYIIYNFFE